MGKHTDKDGNGIADFAEQNRAADGDFDLGVRHVVGQYFHRLEVFPGGGRHVLHDERSLLYDAATMVEHVTAEHTIFHRRMAPVWDQRNVGACTAYAALGLMVTEPFARTRPQITDKDLIDFYSRETALDDAQIPGRYPPVDTGSTGLWSMKLLQRLGYITGYRHAFSLATVKKLLQVSPVSFGLPWYQSMFQPDGHGLITVDTRSGLAGGHQIVGSGIDFERGVVELTNSWGSGWGVGGRAYLRFEDIEFLLAQHGDCSVPTGVAG
jgi:hypothetical protein